MIAILTVLCALVGCKSSSPSRYVSPRVTGKVVDAQTRQPLKDVRVRRITPNTQMDPNIPPRGGEVMVAPAAVFTGADGTFVLESIRDLSLFRKSGWYYVGVSFQRTGYSGMTTNYTPANATNTAKGEPVVHAGDVFLSPLPK